MGEGNKERAIRKNIHLEFLPFLPLYTVTKYISACPHILFSKASGHQNTHFSSLAYTTPHISIGALDSVKIFQSHFFLNLSQYKPCSKCYEKMYMFLQGRLWQDTGGSSPLGGPRRGLESHIFVSSSSHHPSHPIPQEPAAPCPLVSALTPLFPGETVS